MGKYQFFDFDPADVDMAEDVIAGLSRQPKRLSPKYFYDARGSALFEEITRLDEYYLTRTEMALFERVLPEVKASLGDDVCLIEYGSGSSHKIRKLLEVITPKAYVPVDISKEHLVANAKALHRDFPELHLYPVCADITQSFDLPVEVDAMQKVAFFPGSSIGNFEPDDAVAFLRNVHQTVGVGGDMLIGVDRKKPIRVLESAYNDARGVTAEFNLNILAHINERLDANFALEHFTHQARYNDELGCIQMFLRSERDQAVDLVGAQVEFTTGEELHTENSFKYDPHEFADLVRDAEFSVVREWADEQGWFSLFLLEAVSSDDSRV
jgi:dimethylhistidine N-methyltransferase